MLEQIKEQLWKLHLELPKNGLVTWTGGNISARDPETPLGVLHRGAHDSHVRGTYCGRRPHAKPGASSLAA